MFVFFSKLLPLFIYPLGLACLLLVVSLGLWWGKSRWTPLPIAAALFILLLASNDWVSRALVTSLEWQHTSANPLPAAEAIVVLGGATRSADPPRPMVDLNEAGDRLLYAAKLYREQKAPLIVVSGGRQSWSDNSQPEAADMSAILQFFGVPSSAIIQEPDSLNTYENAVNTRKILAERQLQRVLLVTSAQHMPRALKIFQHQAIAAIPAPTDFLTTQFVSQEALTEDALLSLLPNSDRLENTTRAIKEYIGTVIYRLRGWL